MNQHEYKPKTEVEKSIKLSIIDLDQYCKKLPKGYVGILPVSDHTSEIKFYIFKIKTGLLISFKYLHINDIGETKSLDYSVSIIKSACFYGGNRYWFECPITINDMPCENPRVGTLYKPPDSEYFGCRRCHALVYKSQKLTRKQRWIKNNQKALSFKELNKIKASIKRPIYKGEFTKKYKSYLNDFGKAITYNKSNWLGIIDYY